MEPIISEFEFEKETKTTFRFTEVGSGNIGTQYVKKFCFNGKKPEKIKVTVEIVE